MVDSPGEQPVAYDDGLPCPEVGRWAETKYRLVGLYDALFSTGMKGKWDNRVYIDLYAGAGFNRIRGTTRIVAGSPVIALTVLDPFDKYIFCEEDGELLEALRARTRRIAPRAKVAYVQGDCNSKMAQICSEIPAGSRDRTVLSLCFVDPYNLGIKFESIKALSERYVDFLCLLALYMDANRNYARYVSEDSHRVDDFLGTKEWRDEWSGAQSNAISFPRFLAQQFSKSMAQIRYIPPPFYTMKEVRSDEKNLPLYHLALFSRSERAYRFWDEVLKYGTDQLSMDDQWH